MKFRKKPVVIDAVQITEEMFNGTHPDDSHLVGVEYDPKEKCVFIPTLGGRIRGNIGDWIITGVQGELYPCTPDIFEATHEPVE